MHLLLHAAVQGWEREREAGGSLGDEVVTLLTNDRLIQCESRLLVIETAETSPKVKFSESALAVQYLPGEYVYKVVKRGSPVPPRAVDVVWTCSGSSESAEGEGMLHAILESSCRFGVVDEDAEVRQLAWQVLAALLPPRGEPGSNRMALSAGTAAQIQPEEDGQGIMGPTI